jgi:hypothetical protein
MENSERQSYSQHIIDIDQQHLEEEIQKKEQYLLQWKAHLSSMLERVSNALKGTTTALNNGDNQSL